MVIIGVISSSNSLIRSKTQDANNLGEWREIWKNDVVKPSFMLLLSSSFVLETMKSY